MIGGNVGVYLRVTPTTVQWVDVGLDVRYSVESNTEWRVT